MFIELDEPVIFVFDDFHLEILFVDGGTVKISRDTLSLTEDSFQGVSCSRRPEKYLSAILHIPIAGVNINTTDECEFTGAFGLELPEQNKYIDEVVIKFESGCELHLAACDDYMHLSIIDEKGKTLKPAPAVIPFAQIVLRS